MKHAGAVGHGRNEATFRELSPDEVEVVLARNEVARIAFAFHDRVDVEPIHYVYDDHWLYGRTSPGRKLHTLAHHSWIAVEVDEIEGPLDWRSVVIHGRFYIIDPDHSPEAEAEYRHALGVLRTVDPDALTEHDPVPFRNVLFRISMDEVRGREASTRS